MHSNHLSDSNFCNRRPGTAQVHGFCYNDLAELKRLHAQKYVELPKKSMVLHREGCWQTASWDVFPNGNTTQLWKITQSNEQAAVPAVQPIAMQQFLECWESTKYAFHWCEDPVPPLLQVHRNHQQESMRWGWDGLVAGTDGSVDEHLGTWTIRISWDIPTYLTYPDLSATYG